jgi:uncharacterized membrane protein YhaH (DUF805 family)
MPIKDQCIDCRHCVRNVHNTSVDYCVLKAENLVFDKKPCKEYQESCDDSMAKFAKFNTEQSSEIDVILANPFRAKKNKKMFRNPFSFNGRIRRTEYCLSYFIYCLWLYFTDVIFENSLFAWLVFSLPALWFFLAQGTKRCHDRDNSGLFQLIPFYFLWMLFAKGDKHTNSYGEPPK